MADLVGARNRLVFAPPAPLAVEARGGRRIGIPGALTAHTLYPLYATFFTRLGMEVDLNHHADPMPGPIFQPAGIGSDAVITTSSGRRVPFSDPRVTLYFPSFSHYHSRAHLPAVPRLRGHPQDQ